MATENARHCRRYYHKHRARKLAACRLWRLRNKEKVAEIRRAWVLKNRDKCRAADVRYRLANPEKLKARYKKYDTENREKRVVARRNYYNSGKGKSVAALWQKKNPDAMRAINQNRRARREFLIQGAKIEAGEWTELKAKFNGACAYCRKKKPLTMDHVVPLSLGGAHEIKNIVPACVSCNSRKGVKSLLEVSYG